MGTRACVSFGVFLFKHKRKQSPLQLMSAKEKLQEYKYRDNYGTIESGFYEG